MQAAVVFEVAAPGTVKSWTRDESVSSGPVDTKNRWDGFHRDLGCSASMRQLFEAGFEA